MKRIPRTSVRNSGKTYEFSTACKSAEDEIPRSFGRRLFCEILCFGHLEPRKKSHRKWCCTCFWWTEILLCWNIILSVGQWDKQPVWCKFWAKSSMSHHPRAKQVTRMTRNTPGSLPRERCEEVLHRPKKMCYILRGIHDIPLIGKFPFCTITKYPLFCLLVANDPPKKILEMESFLRCANLGSVRPPSQFFWRNPKRKRCLKRRLNSNSQKQLYVNDEMYTNIIYI